MANVKVYTPQGGNTLNVDDGGAIVLGDITLIVNGTDVVITGLPTSDPSVAGAIYSNSGVLTLSAG